MTELDDLEGKLDLADELEATAAEPPGASSDYEYTHEVLQQMRKLSMPKPAEVSDEAWNAAVPTYGQRSLRSSIASQLAEQLVPAGDKSVFGLAFPRALDVLLEVMEDPNESGKTRLAAAVYIADQYSGKASQQIEHSGSIQHELRQAVRQIEQLQATGQIIDVSTKSEPLDSAKQTVDSFLENHVGSHDFSVGKRGPVGEESEQEP